MDDKTVTLRLYGERRAITILLARLTAFLGEQGAASGVMSVAMLAEPTQDAAITVPFIKEPAR